MASAGTREGFLADLLAALSNDHGYRAHRGHDTDVVISSNPVDSRWGAGPDRAEYAAALRVEEGERSVYFWETLTSRQEALAATEIDDAEDAEDGPESVAGMGPGTTSWQWGHGTLRTVVEDVASRHGFLMHPVLARNSATW